MNKQSQLLNDIVNALQGVLNCPVIKANQHSPVPPYPYVSFTIITPMVANGGTWGEYEDGTRTKPFKQVWSFTVQSDDDSQALELSMQMYEFFDRRNSDLSDKGIVAERVSNIANRDNFITIQYEHRYGFDVTFSFMRESTSVIEEPELVPIEITYEKGEK